MTKLENELANIVYELQGTRVSFPLMPKNARTQVQTQWSPISGPIALLALNVCTRTMSLLMIVVRFACIANRFVSHRYATKNNSAACCKANKALACQRKLAPFGISSIQICRTRRWNPHIEIRKQVDFW